MLTVACVLKGGGGLYDWTWVARLRNGVAKHLPTEYRFVCLSDVGVPCERVPLKHDWPGWWSKLELFTLYGPVLFFDLDTVIVGDISELAEFAEETPFAMLQDFYRHNGLGSGVMAWDGRDQSYALLYDLFQEAPKRWMERCPQGDQQFIEMNADSAHIDRLQYALPGQIASYKVHCQAGIPSGARAVCLHGRPKFGDMPATDPVRLAWEACA